MATYRTLEEVVLPSGAVLAANAELSFSDTPPLPFMPLDAEARTQKWLSLRDREYIYAPLTATSLVPGAVATVQNHRTAIRLAKALGWDESGGVAMARSHIANWMTGNAPRVTNPVTLLGASLAAWWDADNLSDGAVASWADKVGSLTVTEATNQPVRAASSLNGRAGVTFDGVNDILTVASTTGLPTGATPGEIWLVCQSVGAASVGQIIIRYGQTGRGQSRNPTSEARPISGGENLNAGIAYDATNPGPHIVGGIFLATEMQGRYNGAPFATTAASTLNTGTTRLRMGANDGASPASFYSGVIRHVLITTLLTEQQRYGLEGWLAWDAGTQARLPYQHPFRWASGPN
jgi:hypothetical protein